MALVTKIQDANTEISKLKDIIKSAHLALMTCKQRRVGKDTFASIIQTYDGSKVKTALAKIEEDMIDQAAEKIDNILQRAHH